MLKIGFIGAGKVGTALAVLLNRKGYRVTSVYSRSQTSSEKLAALVDGCHVTATYQEAADTADLIFITTPDNAIAGVVAQIKWQPRHSVIHCSGAIENIPGSTFALESGEPLLSTLKKMAEDLGGNWITLKAEDKVAYHAAAVFASNYLVTLVKMATDLWKTFSIPTDQATKALLPLIRGTLHNIETIGIPQCLTGPIARGDSGTINKHLRELNEKAPALLFPYKELGLQTIPIALDKGTISSRQAAELELIIKEK
jgi:predicted short-subunit dehydrogenase-like oxidoreductase (DUF2520 family)